MAAVVHCVGHSHIDPVFMWDWREGYEATRATFKTVVQLLDEYPEFTFCATSAALFAWIEEGDFELFRAVQEKVREGRWSLAGGWWVEPDCNMPHGESLVRQALHGQRYFKSRFGVTATVGMNPDSFGHAATIPQILAKSGCDAYVFMRPEKYEKELPGNVFWWEGPDGSKVLAVRLKNYLGPASHESVREIAEGGHFAGEHKLFFYGVGNHGGGVTRASIDYLLAFRAAASDADPKVVFSSPERFRDAVKENAGLPVVRGELQHHARGCYSTVPDLKRLNRLAEHRLLAAERFAAVAHGVLGAPYPHEKLDRAWKDVLYLQFHDALPGTTVPEAAEDARRQYGRAIQTADEVLHYSVQRLVAEFDTRGPGTPIAVLNPSLWERQDPVEMTVDIRHWERKNTAGSQYWWRETPLRLIDEEGNDVPVQLVPLTGFSAGVSRARIVFVPKVPPLGFRVFQVMHETAPGAGAPAQGPPEPDGPAQDEPEARALRAEGTALENRWWRLEVDPKTGWVSRLVDKSLGVEILSGPGAVPVVLRDESDTWAHEVRGFHHEEGRFEAERVDLIEEGPVRATLRVQSAFSSSRIDQQISLFRDTPLIQFTLRVNWQERHKMLKFEFGFNLEAPEIVSDAPYGRVARAADGEEQPGGKWLALTGRARTAKGDLAGVRLALVTDSVYGYDVSARMRTYPWGKGRCNVRLSLLRSPIYAFHEPNEPQEDVPYQYMSQGEHVYRIGLVPLAAGARAAGGAPQDQAPQEPSQSPAPQRRAPQAPAPQDPARAAEAFNEPFITANPTRQEGSLGARGSFAAACGDHAAGIVLKRSEDGNGYVVRCYETAELPGTVDIDLAFLGVRWSAALGPGEIKSFFVPDAAPDKPAECNLLEETVLEERVEERT